MDRRDGDRRRRRIGSLTPQYPPTQSNTFVKATSEFNISAHPWFATDPALSLVGINNGNSWFSAVDTNQRFHIDLGSGKVIKEVMYHNYHSNGVTSNRGAKNFTMWGSNAGSDFADLVYGNDGTWVQLTTAVSLFDAHVESDVPDEKEFSVTNSTSYRYYAFKIADNYGGGLLIGLRHIELRSIV